MGRGGRLIGIHSSGDDPGHQILKEIWPNDNPFVSDRHSLLKAVKNELGSDARHYNIKANSDNRSIFKYTMHSLPSELEASIGTSTYLQHGTQQLMLVKLTNRDWKRL